MAGLKEIALGLTAALQFGPEPEPLGIDLWGQSPEEATYLLKAIVNECADGGIPLHRIRIDPAMLRALDADGPAGDRSYRGVLVETDPALHRRIELHRLG